MRIGQISKPLLLLVLLLCQVICSTGSAQKRLVLTAEKSTDPKRSSPASDLYFAELLNTGTGPGAVEAIQMPGEYGGGPYFPCTLERWSRRRGSWTLLFSDKISEFGSRPNFKNVTVKPGESLRVCGLDLPGQAGSLGDCVRFRLQMSWRDGSSGTLLSSPFLIDRKPGGANSPTGCPASRFR
jgi:hypothetical protein